MNELNLSEKLYGYCHIINCESKKALDVTDWNNENGALIQTWELTKNDNQTWLFNIINETETVISSKFNNKVLDVKDRDMSTNASVQLWDDFGSDNQRWIIEHSGDFTYRIKSVFSHKYLTSIIHDDRSKIVVQDFVESNNQKWWLEWKTNEIILPDKLDNILQEQHKNNGYVEKIKETISACSSDISNISKGAAQLNANGGGWFQKGENIREIAGYVVTLSSVQQRTLDMVVLLIGAAGRMKTDYNVILESIEELSKSHSGSVDVLEYLVKIKNTVNEIKRRDELLDSLITYSNELRDSIEEMNLFFQKEIKTIWQYSEEINNKQKVIAEDLSATKIFIVKEQKYNHDKFTDIYKYIDLKNKSVLDTIERLSGVDESLRQLIEDGISSQKIIKENMSNKMVKNFKTTIVSIIVLAISIIAVFIFK